MLSERVPFAYPAKTPRRDAGPDARITTGRNPAEATLEARRRPANRCSFPLTPEPDEALGPAPRRRRAQTSPRRPHPYEARPSRSRRRQQLAGSCSTGGNGSSDADAHECGCMLVGGHYGGVENLRSVA